MISEIQGSKQLSFLMLGLISAPLPGRLDIKEGTETLLLWRAPFSNGLGSWENVKG